MSTTPSFLTVTVTMQTPVTNFNGTNLKAIVANMIAHDPNMSLYRINTDTASKYDVILSVSTLSDAYFHIYNSGTTAYVYSGGMNSNAFVAASQNFQFSMQEVSIILSFSFLGTIGLSLKIQSSQTGYLRYLIVTDAGGDNHVIVGCTATALDGFTSLQTIMLTGSSATSVSMSLASTPFVRGADTGERYLYPYGFGFYNDSAYIGWYNCRYDGKRLYRLGSSTSLLNFEDGTVVEVNGQEITVVFRSVFVAMSP